MIEKYEKFYGKISVDSGLFLSLVVFFAFASALFLVGVFRKFIKFAPQYFYIMLRNHQALVVARRQNMKILHKSIKYQLDTGESRGESHMLLNIIL